MYHELCNESPKIGYSGITDWNPSQKPSVRYVPRLLVSIIVNVHRPNSTLPPSLSLPTTLARRHHKPQSSESRCWRELAYCLVPAACCCLRPQEVGHLINFVGDDIHNNIISSHRRSYPPHLIMCVSLHLCVLRVFFYKLLLFGVSVWVFVCIVWCVCSFACIVNAIAVLQPAGLRSQQSKSTAKNNSAKATLPRIFREVPPVPFHSSFEQDILENIRRMHWPRALSHP